MNLKGLIVCIGATVCLAGCFSVETARVRPSHAEHVVMNNYGWKFFDWIPLWCGNASEDASTSFALFRDDVTVGKIQARFMKYANGREIECPMYDIIEEKGLSVFGIPLPYVYTYREITLSGTLK